MSLIFVQGWVWPEPWPARLTDMTTRCEHGRPVNGTPCLDCPCPMLRTNGPHEKWMATVKPYNHPGIYMFDQCRWCNTPIRGIAIPKLDPHAD